jgi:membrane protease subunit HflC
MLLTRKPKTLIFVALAAFYILYTSIFVVDQFEQAIVLEFKKPVEIIREPGLQFKMPWQSVSYFDKRVLDYKTPSVITVIAGDQKRLEVDAYLKYKISDPLKFLQSVGNEYGLVRNIDPILESSMRKVISEVPLASLLTVKRIQLMQDIQTLMNQKGQAYGIDVIDVRIISADFPDKNMQDIFARMITEREREAKKLRATGAEEATKITATADKEKTVLLAEAENQAQVLKGEGDGLAAKIYADAFNQDPEFFKFYRTMQAYRESISSKDTKLILSPDNSFFKMMDDHD